MSEFAALKEAVWEANLLLPKYDIVYFTWGNVSIHNREKGVIGIKPSGVPYSSLNPGHVVVLDIDGKKIEGDLKPSSDLDTHLEIYRHFSKINAVVHTHSTYACGWSQAGKDLACLGTTHADCFYGSIPCTRALRDEEVEVDYELNTGKVIVETFKERSMDPVATPGALIKNHGPFAWGETAKKAVENAVTLEIVAKMNSIAISIDPAPSAVSQSLLDKHYYRKHGADAYYGQNE